MANYKEEHIRNNRRLARQIVGGVALLLAVIGLFTVLGWVVSLLRSVLDDSDRRKAYEDRLFGMVMLDPLAFSDVSSVDTGHHPQAGDRHLHCQPAGAGLHRGRRQFQHRRIFLSL